MKLFVGAKGIVICDGKVLLLRESSAYKEGTEEGKWDVPGGRIEPNEAVRDGLMREVKEESGLVVKPGKLLNVNDGFPVINGEKCHVVRIYFLCDASESEVVLSQDHDKYDWVNPKDFGDRMLVGDLEEIFRTL